MLEDYRNGIEVNYKFKTNNIIINKIIGSLLLYLLKHIIDNWEQL